ncbi:MAG: signal peptidase II [Pirellulales bacterium]
MPFLLPNFVSTVPPSENNTDLRVPMSRYYVFFPLAVFGCLLDLWTKTAVFNQVGYPGEHWRIENFFGIKFGFETTINEGALFGLGQGWTLVFAGFSVIAAIGIVYWLFVKKAAHDWLLTTALGGVMAGIFGNLYDRLGFSGVVHRISGNPGVRDWISVNYMGQERHAWPNFNIADCFLVCGAFLLLLHAFFAKPPTNAADRSPSKTEA